MIDPSKDEDLDALLGGGRLTGPARDRVFEKVVAAVDREPRRPARRRLWAFAVVAAGAAAVLVVAPRIMSPPADGLRAKGDQASPALQLDLACVGGTLAACPQGATLMFGAAGAAGTGVLSAYAEPTERGLERIWYFSGEGESPRLTVGSGTAVAQRAVRLGPEHAPGRYRIHAFLTPSPVSRQVLLAGGPRDAIASRELDLRVSAPAAGEQGRSGSP
jgi:hypothetical protein